jgi:hypothetical protein
MTQRLIHGDFWVHVFEKGTFGGRGRRLGPGERIAARKIGSVIVGPSVSLSCLDKNGQEILTCRPRELVKDFRQLTAKRKVSYLEVVNA